MKINSRTKNLVFLLTMLMLMILLPASAMAAQETWANEKTAASGTINGVLFIAE